MTPPDTESVPPVVIFGVGLGAWNGVDVSSVAESSELVVQADRDGLDLFTMADHPYFGEKLDAYSLLGFLLGRTERLAGAVTVTSLPCRPPALLAREIASLSALSGGRVYLGIGAGAIAQRIDDFGARRVDGAAAVRALAEAITLIRLLCGGGDAASFEGEFYRVSDIPPADAPAPPIWTGSVGPKSLAVTGRLADGWIPPMGADWLSPAFRQSRPLIDAAAVAAGRHPAHIVDVFNFGGRITPTPLAATRDEDGRWVGGSVEQWVDELTGAVLDHGVRAFVFRSTGEEPVAVAQARWGREIVPAVRAAIA